MDAFPSAVNPDPRGLSLEDSLARSQTGLMLSRWRCVSSFGRRGTGLCLPRNSNIPYLRSLVSYILQHMVLSARGLREGPKPLNSSVV